MSAPLIAAAVSLVLVGCLGTDTRMLVEVESDLAVPDDLDGLRIEVVGSDSGAPPLFDETHALTAPFPFRVLVRPRPGHDAESVTIAVAGTLAGVLRIRHYRPATFVPGAETVVRIQLTEDCVAVECPPVTDCRWGRCSPVALAGGGDAGPADGG